MCECKICNKCGVEKPIDDYYIHKGYPDGRNSTCKLCVGLYEKHRISKFDLSLVTVKYKICSACNINKSLENFSLNKYNKDGHCSLCKDCTKERSITYRFKNKIIHENNSTKIDIKYCGKCGVEKPTTDFNLSNGTNDGFRVYCKSCEQVYITNYRKLHPESQKRSCAKRRHFRFKSINKTFNWCAAHHLHLENNNAFVIHIPEWLHQLYYHNSHTQHNMQTMNAIALDFWINEYSIYKDLYEL